MPDAPQPNPVSNPDHEQWMPPKDEAERREREAAELEAVHMSHLALGTFNSSLNESAFKGSRSFEGYKTSVEPALEHFRPDRESRADTVIAYNLLARFTRPLTPRDKPAQWTSPDLNTNPAEKKVTIDAKIKAKLDQISPYAFGPSGPRMITDAREVAGKSETFEWHGTPIMVGISNKSKVALAGSDEAPTADLMLYRDTEHRWMVRGVEDEVEYIPKTGLSLGRTTTSETAPHLGKTVESMTTEVSRNHISLLPQQDGTIKILDHSTFGTYVRDQYLGHKWDESTSA